MNSPPDPSARRPLPSAVCDYRSVFSGDRNDNYLSIDSWDAPVQFFVGPNGGGKTRTARAITKFLKNHGVTVRYLQAERLMSFHHIGHYGGGFFGPSDEFKGFALNDEGRNAGSRLQETFGMATDAFYILRDQHDIRLRIVALLKKGFGRELRLEEVAGMLHPQISVHGSEYSLLRDEGQGLKEVIVLLAYIYSGNWDLLVLDEPELHLHPAATALLIGELSRECSRSGRRALVVTHEPRLIVPRCLSDLNAVWVFRAGKKPMRMGDAVSKEHEKSIDGDLAQNTHLVSDLVFSPRAVLVEGDSDVAALSSAALRLVPDLSGVHTEFVKCGGSSAVARWFEIAQTLGVPVFAIADLDALFDASFARAMDAQSAVKAAYARQWQCDKTHEVLRPILDVMRNEGVEANAAARRAWLANVLREPGSQQHSQTRSAVLLEVWRSAGVWLHSQGDLEATMGFASKVSPLSHRAKASAGPTDLDSAVNWAVAPLDLDAEVSRLVQSEVERIAQDLQRRVGLDPELQASRPFGATADADSRFVHVIPIGPGRHRIVVQSPGQLCGYWVEFDRGTPPNGMILKPPVVDNATSGAA